LVSLCLGVGATVLANQRARPTSQGLSEITLIFKERQACLPGPRPWFGPRVQCSAPRLGGGMIGIGAHPSTPCLKNHLRLGTRPPKPLACNGLGFRPNPADSFRCCSPPL